MLTRYIRFSIYIFSTLLTAGCVLNDVGDLEQYKGEVLARPGGRIEPIPEIKPYEAYAYKSAAAEARDPFLLFYQKVQQDFEEDQNAGLTEEMEKEIRNRNREELEAFPLDSLRMVGTLEDADENWGIVLDPDRTVHRVKVGNYMGKNIGKVLNVFEDRIELREIIRNSEGRWEERQAALAIAE